MTSWKVASKEQIDAYNAKRRAKYAEEQEDKKWGKSEPVLTRAGRKRADEQKRQMLQSFLNAKTPHEKREVIKSFNPYYFQFGDRLDPRNPYEEDTNY